MTSLRMNDRYRVIEMIGAGPSATLYSVQDEKLECRRVLKQIPTKLQLENHRTEFEHPGVVCVHDRFREGDSTYLVMEPMAYNLEQFLSWTGQKPVIEILGLARVLVKILADAHAAGFLHLNLKPSNILFNSGGEPQISSFSEPISISTFEPTHTGNRLSSVAFIAPELRTTQSPADERSDLYSICACLFWALTGLSPLEHDFPRANAENKGSPLEQSVLKILIKGLSRRPDDRFANADELLDRLSELGVTTPKAFASYDDLRSIHDPSKTPIIYSFVLLCVASIVLGYFLTRFTTKWLSTSSTANPPAEQLKECDTPKIEFSNPASANTGFEGTSAQLFDIDQDGFEDLFVAHNYQEELWIFWGNKERKVGDPTIVKTGRTQAPIVFGDITGNGLMDFVVSHGEEQALSVFHGTGPRTFQLSERLLQTVMPARMAMADWTNDGILDLFIADGEWLYFRPGDGKGSFVSPHVQMDRNSSPFARATYDSIVTIQARTNEPKDLVFSFGRDSYIIYKEDNVIAGDKLKLPLNLHEVSFDDNSEGYHRDKKTLLSVSRRGRSGPPRLYAHFMNTGATILELTPKGDKSFSSCHIPISESVRHSGRIRDLGDFDGDGVIDIITNLHCAYCTSFVTIFFGSEI